MRRSVPFVLGLGVLGVSWAAVPLHASEESVEKRKTTRQIADSGPSFESVPLMGPTLNREPIGTGVPSNSSPRAHLGDEPNLVPQLRQAGGSRPAGARLLSQQGVGEVPAGEVAAAAEEERWEVSESLSEESAPALRPDVRADYASLQAESLAGADEEAVDIESVGILKSLLLGPQLTVEVEGPARMTPGEETLYRLRVSNMGRETAEHVTLDVAIQSKAQVTRSSLSPELLDDVYRFGLGAIDSKEATTLTLAVVALEEGDINLATRVSMSSNAAWQLHAAESEISVQALGPDSAALGDDLNYQVQVRNNSGSELSDLEVRLQLPEGLRLATGQSPTMKLGRMESGEAKTLMVGLIVHEDGDLPINFQVYQDESLVAEQTKVLVVETHDFSLGIVGPETVTTERAETYQIEASNFGGAKTGPITLRLWVPEGIKVLALDRPANFDAENSLLTWELSQVEADQRVVVKLKAQATRAGLHTFVTQATTNEEELALEQAAVRVTDRRVSATPVRR